MSAIQQMLLGYGSSIPPPASWFEIVIWTGNGVGDFTHVGLDLSNGGLVWVKARNAIDSHALYFKDTSGATVRQFSTNNTTAPTTPSATLDSTGFTVPHNVNGRTYVAWVFKKSAGNFDIVPYVGNGSAGHTVAHSMGSTPKMLFCCPMTGTKINYLQHKSYGGGNVIRLENSAVMGADALPWNNTAFDSANFTLGTASFTNASAVNFVAFIFGGSQFEAGSFIGNGTTSNVTVGFAPRLYVIRRSDSTQNWAMFDTTRTPSFTGNDANMSGSTSAMEQSGSDVLAQIANGVSVTGTTYNTNASSILWYALA